MSVKQICSGNYKSWWQIPKATLISFFIVFFKNTREIQSDYLCFLNYIRQMYHLTVLCLQVKHFQSKKWVFFKFVWGFIKVANKSQKQHFFLFHFNKNIREVHPVRLSFVYLSCILCILYKTNVSSKCFVFTRQTISK